MNKKIQLSIMSIFIAAALIGSAATVGNNMAFAGGNDDDDGKEKDKKSHHNGKKSSSNDAIQGIGQSTETLQSSECFSAGSGNGNSTDDDDDDDDFSGNLASCNNVALSFNLNDGNNALGQQ